MSSELPASKSEQVSIANGSFIPGKNLFYFSVCSSFGSCKIHEGIIRNDSIVSHKALPSSINPELSSSTHPFVCSIKGKKTLVFSSDRSGGFGGMDLWVSVYNGQWSRAKNLGKNVMLRIVCIFVDFVCIFMCLHVSLCICFCFSFLISVFL